MYFCILLQPLRIVELSAFLEQQRMDPESVGKLICLEIALICHLYLFSTLKEKKLRNGKGILCQKGQ